MPILIHTTTNSKDVAETIATHLVEHALAACVSVKQNICSVYSWENKINKEQEFELTIKTVKSKQSEIERQIKELSNYSCPEFIVTPILAMSEQYHTWFNEQLL